MADDVASGAYAYLAAQPPLLNMLGAFPPDDALNGGQPFLFVRNIYQRLEGLGIVQRSQAVAMVLMAAGSWSTPLDRSSARFTRLELDVWVDPLRDPLGNITSPAETELRGMNAWYVADSFLHRIGTPEVQVWGDLVTVGCTRLTEPAFAPVPDGDGLIRAVVYYGVQAFGTLDPPGYQGAQLVRDADAGHVTDAGESVGRSGMAAWTLFGQSGAPPFLSTDTGSYTMGVQFAVSQAMALEAIWFYSPTGAGALPTGIALYQAADPAPGDGVLLASQAASWSGAPGSGWVRAAWTSPPALAAGTKYKGCIYMNNTGLANFYGATANYWDTGPGQSGITSGPLSAPNSGASDGGQCSFTAAPPGPPAYPTTQFNESNYWVDVEVQ